MVEHKGIVHYDDACSRTSNEEDSLLSASSSPNITSPSSTSALSAAGSSLDEGVDMGLAEDHASDMCKRILFNTHSEKFHPHRANDDSNSENDLPIDLSMKKPRCSLTPPFVPLLSHTPKNFASSLKAQSRRESGELVIDEDVVPSSVAHSPAYPQNTESAVTPASRMPEEPHASVANQSVSQFAPTYLPWSYVPSATTMPFASSALPTFWHPALLMSQAARQLAPGMGALPAFNFPATSSAPGLLPPAATTDALKQMYDHNVLAEFSRICSQAQHLYGSHVLPEGAQTYNVTAGQRTSPTILPANTERRMSYSPQHSTFEKYVRENRAVVKQEPMSPQTLSRKRKHDDSQPSNSAGDSFSPRTVEREISPPVGKRIREEYHKGVFDSPTTNSPPTMVPAAYSSHPAMVHTAQESEENRMVPKPVDFKPCRFPCNECGRTYATVGGLVKHAKSHHDPDNSSHFKCKTCEKEYNSLGALKMHIRTHTLPCKCHICGKAFSRTWLLQGHIRTHTGEKPYQCSVCSRAFADRSNLRAHMQTHESVKRYACTSCDKTFSRISLLNRHHVSGCAGSA